ncbi:transporter substrate-binding domain-containing protein [Pseudomonas sp. S60]|nr:transporter substrate-binding domain-containing protein [Pseudomonas sp. S60]
MRGLAPDAADDSLRALVHRIKGGAKMIRVRTVVARCEAVEQAVANGQPTREQQQLLQASLQTLLDELGSALSATAMSR